MSCPSGYFGDQPTAHQENYITFSTSNGCYKPTGCKSGYSNTAYGIALATYQGFSCYTEAYYLDVRVYNLSTGKMDDDSIGSVSPKRIAYTDVRDFTDSRGENDITATVKDPNYVFRSWSPGPQGMDGITSNPLDWEREVRNAYGNNVDEFFSDIRRERNVFAYFEYKNNVTITCVLGYNINNLYYGSQGKIYCTANRALLEDVPLTIETTVTVEGEECRDVTNMYDCGPVKWAAESQRNNVTFAKGKTAMTNYIYINSHTVGGNITRIDITKLSYSIVGPAKTESNGFVSITRESPTDCNSYMNSSQTECKWQ